MRVYLLFFDLGQTSEFLGVYNSLSKAIVAGNTHAKRVLVWGKGRDETQIISGEPSDEQGYVIGVEDVQ